MRHESLGISGELPQYSLWRIGVKRYEQSKVDASPRQIKKNVRGGCSIKRDGETDLLIIILS